jgi:hypothetical protein
MLGLALVNVDVGRKSSKSPEGNVRDDLLAPHRLPSSLRFEVWGEGRLQVVKSI